MKINIKAICFILIGIFSFGITAVAQDWSPVKKVSDAENIKLFKSYKNYANVPSLNLVAPKIVEADFSINDVNGNLFGVFDEYTNSFVPYVLIETPAPSVVAISAKEVATNNDMIKFFDGDYGTYDNLYLNQGNSGLVSISVEFPEAIKSNTINLWLGYYVALPNSVTLKSVNNNSEVTILNNYRPTSNTINFPVTVSKKWIITMQYSQMISISDIQFNNLFDTTSKKSLRFLAIPNHNYKIYLNPESQIQNYADYLEKANLQNQVDVKRIGLLKLLDNPSFTPMDTDGDGIVDSKDNCQNIYNPDQADLDKNGIGDKCDDYDHDYILNNVDNCIDVSNYNQMDTDGDKIGDACDPDESRFTERYPWIVWAGIGFSSLVFIGLLFVAGNKMRKGHADDNNPQV